MYGSESLVFNKRLINCNQHKWNAGPVKGITRMGRTWNDKIREEMEIKSIQQTIDGSGTWPE